MEFMALKPSHSEYTLISTMRNCKLTPQAPGVKHLNISTHASDPDSKDLTALVEELWHGRHSVFIASSHLTHAANETELDAMQLLTVAAFTSLKSRLIDNGCDQLTR
jgi:hypothetical protein